MKPLYYILGTLALIELVDVILFAPRIGIIRHKVPAIQSYLRTKYRLKLPTY